VVEPGAPVPPPEPPLHVVQGPGFTTEEMIELAKTSDRVLGLPREHGGSGFPSPWTALGAFAAIRACAGDLRGARVAVLGTGHVGARLVRLLLDAGASVVAADLDRERAGATGADVVSPDELPEVECDVFSPNARGEAVSPETARRLRCRFVAGSANDQVPDPEAAAVLARRGVRHVPEEIAGSGWILNLAAELDPGGYDESRARKRVLEIEAIARESLFS